MLNLQIKGGNTQDKLNENIIPFYCFMLQIDVFNVNREWRII